MATTPDQMVAMLDDQIAAELAKPEALDAAGKSVRRRSAALPGEVIVPRSGGPCVPTRSVGTSASSASPILLPGLLCRARLAPRGGRYYNGRPHRRSTTP